MMKSNFIGDEKYNNKKGVGLRGCEHQTRTSGFISRFIITSTLLLYFPFL